MAKNTINKPEATGRPMGASQPSQPPTSAPLAPEPSQPSVSKLKPAKLSVVDEIEKDLNVIKSRIGKLGLDEHEALADRVGSVIERESSPSRQHLERLIKTLDGIVQGSGSLQERHKDRLREYAADTFLKRL